jgi:uncharacterized protein (DUF2249 family)/quercetin dioxygenase-like cupin family protein
MSEPTTVLSDSSSELDVREIPKPQRHPLIFERFASLQPQESFDLVNSHDPKHLRQEFERDHPGTYDWTYVESGPVWRIRITRLTTTDLPRVLCDTTALASGDATADATGAVWKLEMNQRHLDSNIIHMQPNAQIDSHAGPDLDVMMHVLGGSGELAHERDRIALSAGTLIWLPRRSQRSITAGADGLTYLTVHQRRPGLSIGSAGTLTAPAKRG